MAVTKKSNSSGVEGNLELGFSVKKKRFSVGGDPNTVVEFDPTDLGVAARLSKALPEFKKLDDKWDELTEMSDKAQNNTETDEQIIDSSINFSNLYEEVERDVRQLLDEVFDSQISDKLLGNSSAFSPVNGFFKYEHIITALLGCYEKHIQDEAPKFNSRKTQKYTNKYIKK